MVGRQHTCACTAPINMPSPTQICREPRGPAHCGGGCQDAPYPCSVPPQARRARQEAAVRSGARCRGAASPAADSRHARTRGLGGTWAGGVCQGDGAATLPSCPGIRPCLLIKYAAPSVSSGCRIGEMDALGVAPARQIAQRRRRETDPAARDLAAYPKLSTRFDCLFKQCCALSKDPPREPPRRRLPRACKRRNQGAACRPHFRSGARRPRGDAAVLGSRASGRQPPAGPLPAPWRLTTRGGAAAGRPGTPATLAGSAGRRRGRAAAALPLPALRSPHDLQQRQHR